jgi:hypothetical protein
MSLFTDPITDSKFPEYWTIYFQAFYLNYLAMMAKRHTVVVVFFENTELEDLSQKQPQTKEDFYETVIAEKLAHEKTMIINKLRQRNILSLLTHPNDLTIKTINKNLEIKARGMV